MAPDRLSRTFRRLSGEAVLPPVRLHDLRHGAATLATSLATGGGPEGRPGHAWPLQHRPHSRHLHLGAPRGRPQGRRGHRHAHHPGRVPGPRHRPAASARAARPRWRRPGTWQPRPSGTPSQPPGARGPGHQQEPAQRNRPGQTPRRAHDGAVGGRASGHTTANLCPYQHTGKDKTWGKTPGQYGCAARDSNPDVPVVYLGCIRVPTNGMARSVARLARRSQSPICPGQMV